MTDKKRCAWVSSDPAYIDYHDEEWGVPVYDDRLLFEFLILEGAQAGLSWITILKRREHYRHAFDDFNAKKIACYDQKKMASLLQNTGIIRNRLKIEATIINAQAYLRIKKEFNHFSDYLWQFVAGLPKQNHWRSRSCVPVTTKQSDCMAKDLKKRGFKFVGSTICYALMQAVGMVNDHTVNCFRHQEILILTKK
jgi:DNA-3-methyladenine glycosylase I